MWQDSFAGEVKTAAKEQLWEVLTDVGSWHTWDNEIEWMEAGSKAAVGVDFYLKPKGGPKTRLTVTRYEYLKAFEDVAHLPLAKMYTLHTFTDIPGGVRITVSLRIEGLLGFLWKNVIGKKQILDGQKQIQNMAVKAAGAAV